VVGAPISYASTGRKHCPNVVVFGEAIEARPSFNLKQPLNWKGRHLPAVDLMTQGTQHAT